MTKKELAKTSIINATDDVVNVNTVAAAIGAAPQALRHTAHTAPEKLGFPVIVCGKRVKIPRIPFCRYMGWM